MSTIRLHDRFRLRIEVVPIFAALVLGSMALAQSTPEQNPPAQQPSQQPAQQPGQQPDQTPDAGGPGGENGPIALPKKKDKPEGAPPPAPTLERRIEQPQRPSAMKAVFSFQQSFPQRRRHR